MGDDAVFFLGHENTFNLLRLLTEKQINLFFMAGNRDFLVGQTFSKECGVTLLTQEHILEVDSRKILLRLTTLGAPTARPLPMATQIPWFQALLN